MSVSILAKGLTIYPEGKKKGKKHQVRETVEGIGIIENHITYHYRTPCSAWIVVASKQTTHFRFKTISNKIRAECFLFLLNDIVHRFSTEL